jgi:hypothetical protein
MLRSVQPIMLAQIGGSVLAPVGSDAGTDVRPKPDRMFTTADDATTDHPYNAGYVRGRSIWIRRLEAGLCAPGLSDVAERRSGGAFCSPPAAVAATVADRRRTGSAGGTSPLLQM